MQKNIEKLTQVDAIVDANLNTKYDSNMDEKVEENMGTIVGIKLSMNCGETNVDTTTNANLDAKRRQNWMQKEM